ncbi:MAG: diguanylate cyclase [Nitriliruptoraceae bacterium]
MDIETLIATGTGRRAADGRTQATKRSLLAVSRSLEAIAEQLAEGRDAFAVVSLFEDASYFAFERERYARLARQGRVVVGFAGVQEAPPLPAGVAFLPMPPGDALENEWTVLVLSEPVAAGLVATDLQAVVAARSLERGRLFSPLTSSEPGWVLEQAARVLAAAPAQVRAPILALGEAAARRPAVRGEQVLREELEAGWWRALTVAASIEQAERAALTDPLTGAYNRRFLEGYLARIGPRAPELAVVLFDLDGFKGLNDRFGHSTGDAALRRFVHTVRNHIRETDVLVRYGGDEWLLILPSLALEAAEQRVDAILADWSATRLPAPAEHAELAASAGVGVFAAHELDVEAIDAAMYVAKAAGGGQRVSLPSSPPMT